MAQNEPGTGIIATAIARPVTVTVCVLLLMLFGLLSLFKLPIQLTPDLQIPTLTVTTAWPGATPAEVEREILLEQEEALKSVQGVERMTSEATNSQGVVTLEFAVGTPIDEALVRVTNRLSQVPNYPDAAREPVVSTADSAGPPLAVIVLRATDGRSIAPYRTWVEDEVIPNYERVKGVAQVRFFGGQDTQVEVDFDPAALAARGVSVERMVSALRAELRDVSGGAMDLGKRRYTVRTAVAPVDPVALEGTVLGVDAQGRVVRLGDVAKVQLGLRDLERKVLADGRDAMALLFDRETGANVLSVTDEILEQTRVLNEELVGPRGLELVVVSEQTGYIRGALALVRENLIIGAVLAVGVLWAFLRNLRASLFIGAAIPVCAMGTIVGMSLMGRTVNIVSLAGIAFAVGMVVDASIVVLENIDTWRRRGVGAREAALEGTREVWGAILASTATTVAVFLPILGWTDEVGELLRDVSVAMCFAITLSLLASVLMLPALAARLPEPAPEEAQQSSFNDRARERIGRMVAAVVRTPLRAAVMVLLAMLGSGLATRALLPAMEYLPTGNRNLMFGVVVPPPAYSVSEMARVGEYVQSRIVPHIGVDTDGIPAIGRTFFVALPGQGFMGASAQRDADIAPMVDFVRAVLREVPGVFAVANQTSLFSRNLSGGRTIDVDITGSDLSSLLSIGGQMMGSISKAIPDVQARPVPTLDPGAPELRLLPRREQATALGMSSAEVGLAVDALVDGRIIGELGRPGETQVDVVVRAVPRVLGVTELMSTPIAGPRGQVLPLSTVAELVETVSPTTIRRVERRRALTLQVTPPAAVPLEEAMRLIREEVVAPMRESGQIPAGVRVSLAGAADKLDAARLRMGQAVLLAVLICFLLMAAMFEDFVSPIIIMTAVPLAGAGGIAALRLVDATLGRQPLDMMTALGFIILVGTVVNNAILIVDGALTRLRQGEALESALVAAVTGRVRPILMTTCTTMAGLLPLVLAPGSGSELYRGIGAIVLGGMLFSTAMTLFVVPALASLIYRVRRVA